MKSFKVTLVLLVLATLVAACGGAAPTTAPAAPAATSAPAAAKPAATAAPAAAVATSAPAAAATAAPAAAAGTLVGAFDVGPTGNAQSRPYDNTAGNTWLMKLWSPLVSFNADFTALVPELALKWTPNADATQWTFSLRPNVKWHDGQPFTADDVKFTFELAYNPAFGWRNEPGLKSELVGAADYIAGKAKEISGIKVVDPQTVQFQLSRADAKLPYNLTVAYILPQHALKDQDPAKLAKSDWFLTSPVGTGPFKLGKYVKDQYMDLVPNPDYWNGQPKLAHLINRYFSDEAAAAIALEKGEIQFAYVANDVAARLKTNSAFKVLESPSNVPNYIIFNERDKRLQDVRVRQAVWYAIDRDAIVKDIFKGAAYVPVCSIPDKKMWPANANTYAYNPDKAKQLLKDANWNANDSFEIWTYYTAQNQKDALQAIQQYLAQVGIKVTLKFMDTAAYNAQFYTGEGWTLAYRGTSFTYGQSGRFQWLPNESTKDKKSWGGIDDAKLIQQVSAAETALTDADYVKAMQGVCQWQNDNVPEAALWVANRYGAVSSKAANFVWVSSGSSSYDDNAEKWTLGQ
ncbi:MAG TPA: ABC transporter substrate-binding protein [Anaerolineae bacterium]